VYPVKTCHKNFEMAMKAIGGKWKGLVLYHLLNGAKRTGELQKLISTITQKMLIQTLRELEDDGLVQRKVYNQVPPKVEYSLTNLGLSLQPILMTLVEWGEMYTEQRLAEEEI
jgi:DNA-binding HxlR family transcriptional regulator